jgi:hypothetical protein
MSEAGQPSAVPVPEALVALVFEDLHEVRMGVFLASVVLRDGRVAEPVVINSRPHFIGLATSSHLDMVAVDFETDDVVGIKDASHWDHW